MSETSSRKDLRQELSRASRQISFNFWQEFERIRAIQLQRLLQERQERKRINTLVSAADTETRQLTEALSRSILSQGKSLEAMPLPDTSIPAPEAKPSAHKLLPLGARKAVPGGPLPIKHRAQNQRLQMANKCKGTAQASSKPATKISANPSKGAKSLASSKTAPDISKRKVSRTTRRNSTA
ncbi:uncharacterized protein LOC117584108 [Drosophila guanche]|uniref:Uncharacterized protein n=1 Tax=Drosophila guanche TaxID=7266 RepID=A0A3B0JHK4_DROGU|nr:uncharacterized protein LOC117584108 [Drosophila guanche]SPP81827.1 Hypothetical predicted protein [Drosophila guanche]